MHKFLADRRVTLALGFAAIGLIVAIPWVGSMYWVRILVGVFMFATMASATNVLSGYAGYAALGNVFFFGIGAYAAAYLAKEFDWSFYTTIVGGGLIAVVMCVFTGYLVLRCKGHYFVMATIGLTEASREILANLGFLGGSQGLTLPLINLGSPQALYFRFYYLMLVLMLLAVLSNWLVARSPFGLALRAIRADEETALTAGINTSAYKIAAWAIGAFFIGMTGSLYAYWQTFIEPKLVFNVLVSIKMFVMMMLGGMGTVIGPVIGAFIVEILNTVVWSTFLYLHYAILGVLFLVIVLFVPTGLVGKYQELLTKRKSVSGVAK